MAYATWGWNYSKEVRSRACQKSRISQRRTNILARFQIHSAPSLTMTTTVCWPTQPNSRNCAYRAAKMVSASPRQLTRKRRTTEWRPGEVSTRSLGNSSTPVLTSWNWPSWTAGKGGSSNRAELARRMGITPTAVSKAAKQLKQEGFIAVADDGRFVL